MNPYIQYVPARVGRINGESWTSFKSWKA